MGVEQWHKLFSEINCIEQSNDEPEDWKSNEVCSLCNSTKPNSELKRRSIHESTTNNLLSTNLLSTNLSNKSPDVSTNVSPSLSACNLSTSNLTTTKNPLNNYLDKTTQISNQIASLLNLSSSLATNPIMTNTNNQINDSDHINSFNALISNENMANQNGTNPQPEVKIVCIYFKNCLYFIIIFVVIELF